MSYYDKSPDSMTISWAKENLTVNDAANVRISLWGYRETRKRPEMIYITDLAPSTSVANKGSFKIVPSQYRTALLDKAINREQLADLQFGFIQINLTDPLPVGESEDVKITPKIWSRPIPLAWYFGPLWERYYGTNWAKQLCDLWLMNDRFLKGFAHELSQCPCKLDQALADKGRFIPDFDCDQIANPQCYHHRQSVHCVRTGSPSIQGAEQQCCYDKNSYLMLSYDQKWGSFPRRSHNLGNFPWNEATKVPTLSQWYNDMIPRFQCCYWQEENAIGCETFRFERRPTQDCVGYQAPSIAGVYGDPHFMTFDDLKYSFNGKGEFVLVKSDRPNKKLEVQARFEQMPLNVYGDVLATQLTSVATRGNNATVVEVRTRPRDARWRYRLDVIVDQKRVYFDRPSLKFQHFPGVTVYTPTYILNQSEVIIMFDTGAGVEVVEHGDGYMSARVYLPWDFINQTTGLFGNWSFDILDDFTLPEGVRATVSTNINDNERIYNDFGMKWMVDDHEDPLKGRSLFFHENMKTAASYNNKTFKPEMRVLPEDLIPENRSLHRNRAYELCSANNYDCLYDYSMTYNRDLAYSTTTYRAQLTTLKEVTREKVVSCGVLETPRFGRKDTFFFTPGTVVSFECEQDFIIVGDYKRECLPNGQWNVPDYGYTECLRHQEYSQRVLGKSSGIILAIMIPLIFLFIYIAYRFLKKRKQEQDEEEKQALQYEAQKRKAQESAARKLTTAENIDDEDNESSIISGNKETTVY